MSKKYVLADVIAEMQDKHPSIPIEVGDRVFEVPPPQLWGDGVLQAGADPLASARALLGDQYDDFVAAGGSAAVLMWIVADAAGVSVGESSAS